MDLISLLVLVIVFVVIVVLAIFIIDKTFTGPLAELSWVAKIIVGIIALLTLVAYLHGGITPFLLR